MSLPNLIFNYFNEVTSMNTNFAHDEPLNFKTRSSALLKQPGHPALGIITYGVLSSKLSSVKFKNLLTLNSSDLLQLFKLKNIKNK